MFKILRKFHNKIDQKLQLTDDQKEKLEFLSQFALSDADERARKELKNYLREDFIRFYITFSMLPDREQELELFEIGANPYYLTTLLKEYTKYRVDCSNCFVDGELAFSKGLQVMVGGGREIEMPYINLNIERNWYLPKTASSRGGHYDVVCFCEVIEHMVESPVRALLHVNQMLKSGGILILSTPNVSRLENVAKMLAGANIYDPYSGYGAYGRHNREYNQHEINLLLTLCGFEVESLSSQDVHPALTSSFYDESKLLDLLGEIKNREYGLGQYIFARARKVQDVASVNAPDWLYRSLSNTTITIGERVGEMI